ncbi:MAG: CoA transferase [Pirellulales bacterium]|nr:CoA transferase [Pirellulales bacterium]
MPPLADIHVLDLTMLLPGPLATQILRDMGARVTKIEPPAPGDYMQLWPPMVGPVSATYFAINRGKEIRSLNLKQDADRETFLELVATADVVVEGFRPGVLDKLGVGYRQLAERKPEIILCSISGYGQTGPLARRAGHDLNYQALAGVLSISGGDGAMPPNPQLQVADTAAGSYGAAMLVLAALLERQRTGRGRHIDVSMSEQLLPLMSTLYAAAESESRDPRRDGELLSGGAPCYRVYRTSDGQYFSIGALEPKFWQALVAAMGLPELATQSHVGGSPSDEIGEKLAALFATKTRTEWEQILAPADACCEPVLRFHEVIEHPQWRARDSFETLEAPDGHTLRVPRMPASLAGFSRGGTQQ